MCPFTCDPRRYAGLHRRKSVGEMKAIRFERISDRQRNVRRGQVVMFSEIDGTTANSTRGGHGLTVPSRPPLSSHFRHWLLLPPSGSIAIAPQRSSRLGGCFKKAHQKDHTLIARKNGGSSSRGICANTILATRSHPTCPRQVSPASAATRLQIRPLQSGARAERR